MRSEQLIQAGRESEAVQLTTEALEKAAALVTMATRADSKASLFFIVAQNALMLRRLEQADLAFANAVATVLAAGDDAPGTGLQIAVLDSSAAFLRGTNRSDEAIRQWVQAAGIAEREGLGTQAARMRMKAAEALVAGGRRADALKMLLAAEGQAAADPNLSRQIRSAISGLQAGN